ncbi:hypothetical protein AFLA_012932 [Aspergillus flavus NRRL3357]|nr:uncharacterized protein G4B84_011175 [Aspergillus flavus NRRL3357]KAF7626990.1 hypothetical protein AFLA_012932 [Aspergillus flavus NRRL3357]QMW35684.1 hypothetical protein G4B84_011175 [Aspergillus flavus NRRL3357]QMW47746.1 hypothetical protein G4B11_011225 [Aspergillus flavus]
MRSSRLRTTLSRFQKPKALWPDPERSIGKFLGIKKGNLNIWQAEGPAKEAFESITPHITELLEYSCGPVPSSSFVLFDIFMIGETRETALPHIMFSCKHCEPRKSAVAAMRKSNILEQCPPGIHLGNWDYPPHSKDPQHLASTACHKSSDFYVSQENESISSPYNNRSITVHNPYKEGMGQALQLVLQNTSTEPGYLRTATIGSIVMLSGRRFYLAPAHVRYPQSHILPDMVPQGSRSEDSECEFGGFDDGDESMSDSLEVEFMSQYSLTPESSDLEEDWDLDEDDSFSDVESDCLNSEVQAESPDSSIVAPSDGANYVPDDANIPSLLHPPYPEVKFPFLKSDNLDYCLIEVEETEHYMPDLPVLSQENICQLNSGSVDVLAATGSGNVLAGVLSSRVSYIRLPNGTRFVQFLSVQFEDLLQPGDSGSIVRDARTGMIYGHIVAGDIGSQTAIIIPAVDVLNDLMAKSTSTEIASAEHNPETFTHQRGLETTSKENGKISVHVSRKCPFCPEDAWPHHIEKHVQRVDHISYIRSAEGYDASLLGSQISGRASIGPNTARNIEITGQTSPCGVGSVCEADPKVDLKNNSPLIAKSLHQQRPDPKDDEWKAGQFLERLESQSAQDNRLDMGTIVPDDIDPTSSSDSISLVRPGYPNQALIRDYTVDWICAIPTEDAAAKALLDEEQDSPFCNTSYQVHEKSNPPQVRNTCRWLVSHSNFQSWKNSDSGGFVWLSGKPGSGKSILSGALVDGRLVNDESAKIRYFFKDNEEKNCTETAMRALLHLVFRAKKKLDFEFVGQMWTSAAYDSSTGDVICLLDALEECQQPKRDRLVQDLEQFSTFSRGRVKVGPNVKFLEHLLAQDINGYALGQIGKNIMTISVLLVGGYGTSSAANLAEDMMQRLLTIPIALIIYTGDRAPSSKHDIHLRYVIVSIRYKGERGILQYDFSKTTPQQVAQEANAINIPNEGDHQIHITFGSHNSGLQVGMNNGSINKVWYQLAKLLGDFQSSPVIYSSNYQMNLVGDAAGIALIWICKAATS